MGGRKLLAFVVIWLVVIGAGAVAWKFLLEKRAPVAPGTELQVPFILWGGDVATFLANGGSETQPGSIFGNLFGEQKLKLKLTNGNDFDQQVKDYLADKSPFLRGTMSMLGEASERIGKDEKTKPVVFLQLTWSKGDHLVSQGTGKTIDSLKGKKIALQEGGPHWGMLDDILTTARLSWSDITPVPTKDLTGEKGPAKLFKDNKVDACFCITPDMDELTGGLDKIGTGNGGADKTVKGAFVLISTNVMQRLDCRRLRLPQGLLRCQQGIGREVRSRILAGHGTTRRHEEKERRQGYTGRRQIPARSQDGEDHFQRRPHQDRG